MIRALARLEEEASAQFRWLAGDHPPFAPAPTFSCRLFAQIASMWGAWRNGIPPTAGGYVQQNPRLLAAFAVLDRAEAVARQKAAPRRQQEDTKSFHARCQKPTQPWTNRPSGSS